MKGKLQFKKVFVVFMLLGVSILSHAQVGIGTLNPDNSAQLDITSLNKGLLVPRLPLVQTTNQSPVAGNVANSLLVYNTATVNDVTPGFYYWQGTKWVRIVLQSDPVMFNETLTTLTYNATTNELIYKDEKGISNLLQLTGQTGPQGPIGLTGPAGPQGIPGNDGAIGPQGPIGLTGPQGIQGVQGNTGANGAEGPQGIQGPIGPQGPQGGIGLIVDGTNTTVSGSGTATDPYKVDTPSIPATTVSNTSTANNLNTTVNGVTGTNVNIINSNVLEATNGNLISTVNGVASAPAIPILIAADNGLTAVNGNVQLGGSLVQPTTLTTTAANSLAISGLPAGTATDNIIVSDPATGVLKTVTAAALNTTNWSITGNAGTSSSTNFLGTTDDVDLIFKRDNILSGQLGLNTTFGVESNAYGTDNCAFGRLSQVNNSQVVYVYGNVSMGTRSLYFNDTGVANVSIGYLSLFNNLNGRYNTAVGTSALQYNPAGSENVAVGNNSLYIGAGSENVGIGSFSSSGGGTLTVNRSIFIGNSTKPLSDNETNQIVIGYNATGRGSNTVQIGNFNMTSIGGQVAWSNPSDLGLKKDIVTSEYGLNFIEKLRPVTYKMKKGTTDLQTGFIAQEVETAANSIGYEFNGIVKPKNDNDFYSLRYSDFVVPLVKAVQEQQAQIDKLQLQINQQQKDIQELRQLIENNSSKK